MKPLFSKQKIEILGKYHKEESKKLTNYRRLRFLIAFVFFFVTLYGFGHSNKIIIVVGLVLMILPYTIILFLERNERRKT